MSEIAWRHSWTTPKEAKYYFRWADKTEAENSVGKEELFHHPYLQSSFMFLGETLCLAAFMITLAWTVMVLRLRGWVNLKCKLPTQEISIKLEMFFLWTKYFWALFRVKKKLSQFPNWPFNNNVYFIW